MDALKDLLFFTLNDFIKIWLTDSYFNISSTMGGKFHSACIYQPGKVLTSSKLVSDQRIAPTFLVPLCKPFEAALFICSQELIIAVLNRWDIFHLCHQQICTCWALYQAKASRKQKSHRWFLGRNEQIVIFASWNEKAVVGEIIRSLTWDFSNVNKY